MAWREGTCEYCGRVTMVAQPSCSKATMCVPCFNRTQGRGSCGTYRTHQRCAFCRVPSLFQVEACVLRREYQADERQKHRDALKAFMEEAWALDKRKDATAKEKAALRNRAPALIKAACEEQNKAGEGVMGPHMCVLCHGCVIGAIIEAVSD